MEQLHRWAVREGNRKKPIYEIHKWFARRLGTTFRMLLLGAATPAKDADDLWDEGFFEAHDFTKLTVLDPFMGGGTSLVEAAKCGARVIGVDIDPVACFVTSKELEAVDPRRITAAFQRVASRFRDRILARYATRLPDGTKGSIAYAFWVDEVVCPGCGSCTAAHPHYQLARDANAEEQTVLCRACGALKTVDLEQTRFRCSCAETTTIARGPVQEGKFACPVCGLQRKFAELAPAGVLPRQRLFALDVIGEDGNRRFKAADDMDREVYASAARLWESKPREARFAPHDLIPKDARYDNRPLIYGYRRYSDLFNARQILSLCEIASGIDELSDTPEKDFLALAFSDCLASNNMFCAFAFDYRKLTPLFGLHAYRRVMRPVENNVWGIDECGRGTFSRCVAKVIRGKEYGVEPHEFRYRRGRPVPVITGDKVSVRIRGSTPECTVARSNGEVLNCSATSLEAVATASVDLVLTDPPYYDNLPYSELSDFYHVWLRRLLGKRYAGSAVKHTPWRESLFVGRKGCDRADEHSTFVSSLNNALAECARVLRPDGLMVFTFHHGDPVAWQAVANALLHSPFVVTKVLPVRSEGKSAFHSYGGSLKWDAVLVCRKHTRRTAKPVLGALKTHVARNVGYWRNRLKRRMRTPDAVSLGHALAAQHLSRYEWSPISEALLRAVMVAPEAGRQRKRGQRKKASR